MTSKRNGSLMLLGLAFVGIALSVPAKAAFVSGVLTTGANFTVTGTSLLFCAAPALPCPNTPTGTFNIPSTGTGDFAVNGYANDTNGFTVTNLNSTNAPVGGTTVPNPLPFVIFNSSPALLVPDIELFLTTLQAGAGTLAGCSAGPASGQTCTLPGSSVTFLNGTITGSGSTATGSSSATITGVGEAERISTGQFDIVNYSFTTQFNTPYQAVLNIFNSTGTFSSSESASMTASAVPEPMTSMLMGSGLLAFAFILRRKRS